MINEYYKLTKKIEQYEKPPKRPKPTISPTSINQEINTSVDKAEHPLPAQQPNIPYDGKKIDEIPGHPAPKPKQNKKDYNDSPIYLRDYVFFSRKNKTFNPHILVSLARKKTDRIIKQLGNIAKFHLVSATDISQHYKRKYKNYRVPEVRGKYFLPNNIPLKKHESK